MMEKEILVIGAGITGITLAERLASLGKKVLIIEKRNHVGGNCYDFSNEAGILVQKYGPHIFHTDHKEVWNYLSKFTKWMPYQHKVLGFINKKLVPVPFNLNTLYGLFSQSIAQKTEEKLVNTFGYGGKIPILELRRSKQKDLKDIADFIYKKIFLNYTKKQWGVDPKKLDTLVMGRVPIVISRDDRYFQDKYQGVPKNGYSEMFNKMTSNKNIVVHLGTEYKKIKDYKEYCAVFYTGPIDEFFDYRFGRLQYRRLKLKFKNIDSESYQPVAVVNYPNNHKFTRITEFKKFLNKKNKKTTIGFEYPGKKGFVAWPVLTLENERILRKYKREVEKLERRNVYFVGRLAEYKYYDMDEAVKNSLDLFRKIKN